MFLHQGDSMKTYQAKKEEVEHQWYLVDAEGRVLGRLATELAKILRGKNKPIYTPHVDTGDFVIVVNAGKVALTGKKMKDKIYYHHTGYPGGIREMSAEKLLAKKPTEMIRIAVKGMLPKNSLGRQMIQKLKIYAGAKHPHEAQKPVPLELQ
jgi:large subunit ribosomal protein L13